MRVRLIAQPARANDFRQRAILPDKLEPEINLDGLPLRQAEPSHFLNVGGDLSRQGLGVRFLLRYPRESCLLNQVVKIHQ
jgi:hypothetical protein